jgi:hypothetical protein
MTNLLVEIHETTEDACQKHIKASQMITLKRHSMYV